MVSRAEKLDESITDVMDCVRIALVRSTEEKLGEILDNIVGYSEGNFIIEEYFNISDANKSLLEQYGVVFLNDSRSRKPFGLRAHIDEPAATTMHAAVVQALNSLMKAKLHKMQMELKKRILKGLRTLVNNKHFILTGYVKDLIDQDTRKGLDDAGIHISQNPFGGRILITEFSLQNSQVHSAGGEKTELATPKQLPMSDENKSTSAQDDTSSHKSPESGEPSKALSDAIEQMSTVDAVNRVVHEIYLSAKKSLIEILANARYYDHANIIVVCDIDPFIMKKLTRFGVVFNKLDSGILILRGRDAKFDDHKMEYFTGIQSVIYEKIKEMCEEIKKSLEPKIRRGLSTLVDGESFTIPGHVYGLIDQRVMKVMRQNNIRTNYAFDANGYPVTVFTIY